MAPRFVGTVLLAILLPTSARAQAHPVRFAGAQAADSAQTLRDARSQQAAFERFRAGRLPRVRGLGGGRASDCTRVGRFCFYFSDDGDVNPPPEPPAVSTRRAELVRALDAAAARSPGDAWITGQRVRYLGEHKEPARALAAANACRAEAAWCAALAGFALHEDGRFGEAGEAFERALQLLPATERARWTDVDELLSARDQRTWRSLSPADRAVAERRLWWLADPFWSEPGNDRRTEHFARWVMHALQDDARQVDRTRWLDDSREVVVRYGWPRSWAVYQPLFIGTNPGDAVVGYTGGRSWEWLPPLSVARDPRALKGDEWPTEESAVTITRYGPAYAARMAELPHQFARFRRGRETVLVAAFTLRDDSLAAAPRLNAALVAMEDADGRPATAQARFTRQGVLRVTLPADSVVASLEVRADSSRIFGRRRVALGGDARAAVSDLLLLSDPAARPVTLDEAAAGARSSAEARAGERLAVFWETYDVDRADSMTVRVRLVPDEPGWGRRQLEAVGLARAGRTAAMRWVEPVEPGAVVGRALGVSLPAGLRPGGYTLEVTVLLPGREPAIARRALTVVR